MRPAKEWYYTFKGKEITADGIGAIQGDAQESVAADCDCDQLRESNAELLRASRSMLDRVQSVHGDPVRDGAWRRAVNPMRAAIAKAEQRAPVSQMNHRKGT